MSSMAAGEGHAVEQVGLMDSALSTAFDRASRSVHVGFRLAIADSA